MLTNSKMGGGKLSRAFTLIEIVSAIVIVGIIALITVPITIRLINEAKKRSFLITAEGIVRATSLSLTANESAYDEYFRENEYITFKFSASEGKEGESIDTINGEKIKLSFEGKSPIGGEVNLYKNGDVEVINLTDGTFYVNKDVDTELAVTENSGSLTRKELQTLVEQLQNGLNELKNQNEQFSKKIEQLEKENNEQNNGLKEDKDSIETLTTTVNNINTNMLAKTYPVGSIYISTSSTNPGTIFGGTWESFGTGRTLVGVDTSNTNFNAVSKTGGATTVNLQHSHTVNSHTHSTGNHTLTVAEMPSHNHGMGLYLLGYSGWPIIATPENVYGFNYSQTVLYNPDAASKTGRAQKSPFGISDNKGGGGAHNHGNTGAASPGTSNALSTAVNNLQPYITVYMWKRSA